MPLLPSGTEAGFAAEQLIERAKMLRLSLDAWSAQCDAGALNAYEFVSDFLLRRMKPCRAVWPTYSAVPSVQATIRNKIAGFADDAAVTSTLSSIQSAMDTLITYCETNVRDALTVAGGWIAIIKVENDAITPRTITNVGQLANLKAALQAMRGSLSS